METIKFDHYQTESGANYHDLPISYEVFGQPLDSGAPVVLVCHALTGNSTVIGPKGWWNGLIGDGRTIDTGRYSVLAFNIPGNGYDGYFIENYRDFTLRDMAHLHLEACRRLKIEQLHSAIGGSLGGGLIWEMAVQAPDYIRTIIPVAADWKATDWMQAFNCVQMNILNSGKDGMRIARMMGMMFYRTAESFEEKFHRSINEQLNIPNVESWLIHHADRIEQRYDIRAYRLMIHLLSTLDVTKGRGTAAQVLDSIQSHIVQVAIDSDMYFMPAEIRRTYELLIGMNKKSDLIEISSIHGHDGFLIEFEQMSHALEQYYK